MSGKARRVLVIGGNRFAGRMAAGLLSDMPGVEVAVLNRSGTGPDDVRAFRADRNAELGSVLRDFRPDCLIDFAAYTPTQAERACDLTSANGIHYVHISSASAYPPNGEPHAEHAPLTPHEGWGDYGREKALADECVRTRKPDATILRPAYFIGPDNPIRRCTLLFDRIAGGEPLPIPYDGSALIQTVHPQDLARAAIVAGRMRAAGPINIACAEPTSIANFYHLCVELVGEMAAKPAQIMQTDEFAEAYDENRWPFPGLPMRLDTTRCTQELGVVCRPTPVSVREAHQTWLKHRIER
ncbi:MAG: NAD-dependent epimerase/dehydratase family protein [Planctomycetota bacterium]